MKQNEAGILDDITDEELEENVCAYGITKRICLI